MSSEKIVLQAKDLRVSYGPIQAVKGISFDIKKGEVVSLIGSNGAGKSTTLRALSRIVNYKGTVHFSGRASAQIDLSDFAAHDIVAKGISHCPEGRGIFPNLTVQENLDLGSYINKDRGAVAKIETHCFELFPRLLERREQIAGTLSGGEQQMLAISRALMAQPELLLLDEPSLGLAPLVVEQIFSIIKKINADGITVLLVEQNARMALKISHRAFVLETGKIVLSGKGADLLHDPRVIESYLGGH